MRITLKDGSVKEYAESKSVIDIAYDIIDPKCEEPTELKG